MRSIRFVVLAAVLMAVASPGFAQEWVSWFTDLSITPTVTADGPPVQVDFNMVAQTSGYWSTSPGDSVWMYGVMYNTTTGDWDSGYATRTAGTNTFEDTYSFTLGQPGIYNYIGVATYYESFYYYTTYSTFASGEFNTISRAGIPTLSHLGLALLGLLTAGAGVFLLRRS